MKTRSERNCVFTASIPTERVSLATPQHGNSFCQMQYADRAQLARTPSGCRAPSRSPFLFHAGSGNAGFDSTGRPCPASAGGYDVGMEPKRYTRRLLTWDVFHALLWLIVLGVIAALLLPAVQ